RLLMTSRDVIHSFYVPEFRIKQDVLPGRYTQTWFNATMPGRYQILCAEYCGAGHSIMRGEVIVLKPQEYEDWLAFQHRGLGGTRGGRARRVHQVAAERRGPHRTVGRTRLCAYPRTIATPWPARRPRRPIWKTARRSCPGSTPATTSASE